MWHEFLDHIPKKTRFTLGSKIDNLFIESMEVIFISGYLPKQEKLPFVKKAIGKIDILKFLLQVAWETKILETKKYSALSEPLEEIGRMLGGWQNNLLKQTPPR